MKYTLKYDHFDMKAGTTVYPYSGHTYGLVAEDSYLTGEPHTAATRNADGSAPFFTVPIDYLEEALNEKI